MIFSKIAMIEEHEPADFYKDKDRWRDTTHRRKYYRDNVLRPTLNTLANMRDFNIDIEDVKNAGQIYILSLCGLMGIE